MAYFQLWKMSKYGMFKPMATNGENPLALLFVYAIFLSPIILSVGAVAFTGISSWKSARRSPTARQFDSGIINHVLLLVLAVLLSGCLILATTAPI